METKCQCGCAHTHTSPQSKEKEQSMIRKIGAPVLSGIFLITGIIFQHQQWVGFSHPVVEFGRSAGLPARGTSCDARSMGGHLAERLVQ